MAVSSIPRSVPRSAASTLRRNPTAAWRHLDVVLIGCVAAVSGLGALMVYSATRGPVAPYNLSFLEKQALYVLIGFGVLVLTVIIDYRHFRDWAMLLYGMACALLLFVVSPLGSKSNGAQSWFQLGSFQLQPSEFAKLGLILAIASVSSQFFGEIDRRRLFIMLAVAALPLTFIMLQPDLGTALVLVVITAGALMVAGAQGKQDTALFVGMAPADAPQFVGVAVLEESGFGATAAAPVIRRVFQSLADPAHAPTVRPGGTLSEPVPGNVDNSGGAPD